MTDRCECPALRAAAEMQRLLGIGLRVDSYDPVQSTTTEGDNAMTEIHQPGQAHPGCIICDPNTTATGDDTTDTICCCCITAMIKGEASIPERLMMDP